MANHAWVKTKKKMTPEAVTALLNDLNHRVFKDFLTIEYFNEEGDKDAWGPHVWTIDAGKKNEYNYGEFGSIVFWLKNSKHFEIRHGAGGKFIWWIDQTIFYAIAHHFDGSCYDEGTGKVKRPGVEIKYPQFIDYINMGGGTNRLTRLIRIRSELRDAPSQFRKRTL